MVAKPSERYYGSLVRDFDNLCRELAMARSRMYFGTFAVISVVRLFGYCVVVAGVVAGGVSPAYSQSVNNRVAAETEIRLQQLERETRRLTGQVEQQQYEIVQMREQLSKFLKNSVAKGDSSLSSLGGNVGGGGVALQDISGHVPSFEKETVRSLGTYKEKLLANAAANGSSVGKDSQNIMASGKDESGDYDRAYAYIKDRDFENAQKAFSDFVNNYPNSSLISNAKYWYGETFYVQGNYDKAARIFAQGYQKYPKGPKAAGNLLKLGMSLVGMGKSDDACIAFKQLKKDYSSSAIPVLKRADTEMRKINCN